MAAPIADDDLVELAQALAGLRRELAGAGVVISSEVDVDPEQRFGPWQAVVDAVRDGIALLDRSVAGTLLERSPAVAGVLEEVLAAAEAAAARAGRASAVDEAVIAAIEDAAALAQQVADDDPSFVFTVESFYAGVLAATYATWVTRDVLDDDRVRAGTGLVDLALRPAGSLARLAGNGGAAAVLDVAASLPAVGWGSLAELAASRPQAEAMAAVRLRALVAVRGLGGAEVAAVAGLAPRDTDPAAVADAALVIGDAAVAAAAEVADVADADLRDLAAGAWERGTRRG